jgi:hypothetical protein
MYAICTSNFQNEWDVIKEWISDLYNQRLIFSRITFLLWLVAFSIIDFFSLPVPI